VAKSTYTQAQKDEALALYETDGPTAVQKHLGIPKNTVARWAKNAGIGTVRNEKTAAATESRIIDDKERRSLVASNALSVVDRISEVISQRLQEPDEIPFRDLATVYGIFADKHKLLARFDDDGGLNLPAVDAWLTHMTGGVDEGAAIRDESVTSVGEPIDIDPSL
jgi:hypothetical protein